VEPAHRLLEEADRCVKCGLCLAACPTYRLAALEGESPRGRIALIQGLLQGGLSRAPALERHLDSCLGCRACEAACPSGVRYGALIDGARTRLRRPRGIGRRALLALASRPSWFGSASALARGLGLRRLAGWLPDPVGRWLGLVAPAPGPTPASLARDPGGLARGRVGLFLGCVAREADAAVHRSAARLLAALGYAVICPDGQGCCGAMHLHAGLPERARHLAQINRRAFAGLGLEAVVVSGTGCGAVLREQDRGLAALRGDVKLGHGVDAARLSVPSGQVERRPAADVPRAVDVLIFLAGADWSGMRPRPQSARVAVHLPCSARDAGLAVGDVLGLLARIPGVDAIALDPGLGCCGAAGTYLLHHAATADALREGLLDAVAATGAEVLVTANTGCAMHLRAGLAARGLPVRVAHPVELLAEAFAEAPDPMVRGAHPTTASQTG
jgi:glycolate oxidase iron-sulfur subunit